MRDVKGGSGAGATGGGTRRPPSLKPLSENQENKAPRTATTPGKSRGLPALSLSALLLVTDASRTLVSAGGCKANSLSGEGFNWSENLRDRTKRSPSFSASANPFASRTRALSSTAPEPPKEMPVAKPVSTPPKMKKPDHLGERMLRGDFMMD